MYLGILQYQLHFDLLGLGILCAALILLGTLVWQSVHGRLGWSIATAAALLFACSLQMYRGWMVPDEAWLAMLGAVEESTGQEKDRKVRELMQYWSTDAETMRAAD